MQKCFLKNLQSISCTTCGPLPTQQLGAALWLCWAVVEQPNYREYTPPMTDFPGLAPCWLHKQKPVDEGCVSHDLFAGCWHSSVLCKQQEKQEPGQFTPGLGHVCKEKCLLTSSSFQQAGLHAYLWGWRFSSKQTPGKNTTCTVSAPGLLLTLAQAPLWEWNLDEGEDYLSPYISVIKCKRVRRKTLGFHPREARKGTGNFVGKSVEVRRPPILV